MPGADDIPLLRPGPPPLQVLDSQLVVGTYSIHPLEACNRGRKWELNDTSTKRFSLNAFYAETPRFAGLSAKWPSIDGEWNLECDFV